MTVKPTEYRDYGSSASVCCRLWAAHSDVGVVYTEDSEPDQRRGFRNGDLVRITPRIRRMLDEGSVVRVKPQSTT